MTQAEASAISLKRGMDNECIDFTSKVTDDHDYVPYLDAVKHSLLMKSDIDTALIRLFTARMRLGMFDPPDMVPYTKVDENMLNNPEYRVLARKLANESLVLLKNDGLLPFKPSQEKKIAIVGPLAEQTKVLLGKYNGVPTHSVAVLEGMRAEFPAARIQYVPGTQFPNKDTTSVPVQLLSISGRPGVQASYSISNIAAIEGLSFTPKTLASRVEPGIGLSTSSIPTEVAGKSSIAVRWKATFTLQNTVLQFRP